MSELYVSYVVDICRTVLIPEKTAKSVNHLKFALELDGDPHIYCFLVLSASDLGPSKHLVISAGGLKFPYSLSILLMSAGRL